MRRCLSNFVFTSRVISKEVYNFITKKQAHMLEHLAESVAQFLFAFTSAIVGLELKIQKPSAIPLADFASVSIVRTRSDYPWIQPATKTNRSGRTNNHWNSSKDLELEDVYLALGSNLGNRGMNIATAIQKLESFSTVKAVSGLYDTNPKYVTDQPKFLNCVVKVCPTLYLYSSLITRSQPN